MALPTNIGFGTVHGAFIRAVADSVDADRAPDSIPVDNLEITFTADLSPALVRDMTATPPVIIAVDPIKVYTNDQGILVGPDGQAGVRLIASTDPDIEPYGWTWKCTLKGVTFPGQSFSFLIAPDEVLDLTTLVRVPANPGNTLGEWLAAVEATAANVASVQRIVDNFNSVGGGVLVPDTDHPGYFIIREAVAGA